MAYIDFAFYKEYTPGTTLTNGEPFAELAARASDIIDMLTSDKIPQSGGLAEFSADVQSAIKKATAAQVQTLHANGGISALANGGAIASATIGRFSYTSNDAGGKLYINGIPLAALASAYLAPTGLLYRGMNAGLR